MSLVRIELGDWLKNASIIGLIKVLEHKKKLGESIKIKNDYLEFDSEMLDGFEEAYFKTLISEHEKKLSWYKLASLEDDLNAIEGNEITNENVEKLNDILDKMKSKSMLNSNSYLSAYLLLEDRVWIVNKEKNLAKIKLKKKDKVEDFKEEILKQISIAKEIIKWFKKPEVKRVIAAKNVMYDIIQPFWNNISMLLKTNNEKNMYELYKKDFIEPFTNYVESDKTKYKNNCFTCDNKIKKLGKPEAFDLTWLVKTGADMSRKSSHFWNMNGDAYICPICNLVYSCLPLGFVLMERKGIFINSNQSIKSLKQCNITTIDCKGDRFVEIENLSYYNVLNAMENVNIENIDKEFENIQVVKIDGNNDRRPYSFNTLSPKIMKILYYHRKALEGLIKIRVRITDKYYINLYDEIIRRIYDGKNLFELIHKLLVMYLDKEKFKGVHNIYKILQINTSLTGGKEMRQEDINKFMSYGFKLRGAYESKEAKAKLSGITYRLLNAIKTRDSGKFMDTIVNAHMYMKREIPKEIGLALRNSDVLQNVGYAFVLGLQGELNKKETEGEK
ncbi:CRISPR-associated protein [Clostridium magnum DSM 2767]|uniref:CRISPR-associated protein n=1 Tax=Clostridium magnum DSM 2767 TaxID=1121326 RepID=A0A161WXU3_9CLOT|nr:CRISPR-associated protein [Clostridium magnum DSM 2767]SHI25486.1 CRISPR-associated protein Cst1 [Clostridium magnum DSM 2767]